MKDVQLFFSVDHLEAIIRLLGFPGGASGKEPVCQCRRHKRHRFSPWIGKIPWSRKWQPTPVLSCLQNPMDRGAWWATVRGITKSWTQLKWLSTHKVINWFNLSVVTKKAMAPHSSTLAWKIPWTEEPGRLQSMGSLRVGHDWVTSLSLFTFMDWRRKWQPSPVFLPGESQGQGSLAGCRLWGRTESNTTDGT